MREEKRQLIVKMTEADRDRLEQFREVPETAPHGTGKAGATRPRPQERQPQRRRASKGDGRLPRLAGEPVSPPAGERAELRRETDPSRRANLVGDMIKDPRKRAESLERRGPGRWSLSPTDLDAVLGVLEKHLSERSICSAQRLAELQAGTWRHAALLELAFSPDRPEGCLPQPIRTLLQRLPNGCWNPSATRRSGKRLAKGILSSGRQPCSIS